MTPDDALARLMAGNARFVAGRPEGNREVAERRAAIAEIQRPYALVLCCADSRIAPELVFDQRLGDLFVCRVGGNILEAGALGSFEFAIETVESTAVLVVMGHQRCSALTASVELLRSGAHPEGAFATIVNAIAPAFAAEAGVDDTIRANARFVAGQIQSRSAVVRDAVASGRLRVVPAYYSVDTGRVALLTE
jgi:carbonic anhydrase